MYILCRQRAAPAALLKQLLPKDCRCQPPNAGLGAGETSPQGISHEARCSRLGLPVICNSNSINNSSNKILGIIEQVVVIVTVTAHDEPTVSVSAFTASHSDAASRTVSFHNFKSQNFN